MFSLALTIIINEVIIAIADWTTSSQACHLEEGLQFSIRFLTSISHVSKTSLKSLNQVSKKSLTILQEVTNNNCMKSLPSPLQDTDKS